MTKLLHLIRQTVRGRSLLWRRPGRALRRELSILKRRLTKGAPAVVCVPGRTCDERPGPPLVAIVPGPDVDREQLGAVLAGQTEHHWTLDPARVGDAPYLWCPDRTPASLDPTHLESLVLTVANTGLELAAAGPAPASDAAGAQPVRISPGGGSWATATLFRRNRLDDTPVVGRVIGLPTDRPCRLQDPPALPTCGPWILAGPQRQGVSQRWETGQPDEALAGVPAVAGGKPGILFLLPFLAVGGAERLLHDLLPGLGDHRCLVATLEPHRRQLGVSADRCRELTPHVYTLGDWLCRHDLMPAVRHLIRRWRVRSLVSWNGTVDFFDHAAALGRAFPELRIVSQLFNHEGGWLDHLSTPMIRRVDIHVAVNRRIVTALEERGVPSARIAEVHHGVPIPELPSLQERRRRSLVRRRELGLPEDALVVGSFIRLAPQKRPLDILALAERLAGRRFHFLLVGGGPMDGEVETALDRLGLTNLTRLPMCRDPLPLYDALDLCLMTSEYEGLPVFLLDGMARGLPAVATDTGEIRRLLSGGGGRLVASPGDLDALAGALLELADEGARAEAGRRARNTVVAEFSLDAFVAANRCAILGTP